MIKRIEACTRHTILIRILAVTSGCLFSIIAKLGEGEKMKQNYRKLPKNIQNQKIYTDEIIEAYNKSGINGLFYWIIEVNKKNPIKVEGMNGHRFLLPGGMQYWETKKKQFTGLKK
jgi:signal recognition particle subunit SEC65